MRIDSAGTIWKVAYFKNAEIGESFWCNGNLWRKQSTRTARLVKPDRYAGSWFYFSQNDICEIAHAASVGHLKACRVYTLDGEKPGLARFEDTGPATVETLDGTLKMRVPRAVALSKIENNDYIYSC